jgi:hypothetical protein
MRSYLHDVIWKITHTHRLQSSLIHQNKVTMRPYLHDEVCKIPHTHRSCSQVVDLAARGHWTSSISLDGSENWFLACNKTTKLPSLTCTFGLQEHSASGGRKHRKNNDHWTKDEGLFILKTMIIGHRMKLFILMPRGSGYLPRHGYEQGVCHKNSSRSCVRGMRNPITPYHKNSSSNWEIEKEEEERKAKACALQDLFFAP